MNNKNNRGQEITYPAAKQTPKSFTYLGRVFKPIQIDEKYNWNKLASKLWGGDETLKHLDCINENGYKHEDFYKEAKKNGCGKIDVFEMGGEKVIPCNRLMYYGEPTWYSKKKAESNTELQALQNAADGLGLTIHEKPFYEDKRKTIKKYFAKKRNETVSPVLDYEQLNHFLSGWRTCQKHYNRKTN